MSLILCNLVFLPPKDRVAPYKLLNLALIAPLNDLKSRNIVLLSSNSLFLLLKKYKVTMCNMSKGMSEFLNPDMKNIFYDRFTNDCHLQMSSAANY